MNQRLPQEVIAAAWSCYTFTAEPSPQRRSPGAPVYVPKSEQTWTPDNPRVQAAARPLNCGPATIVTKAELAERQIRSPEYQASLDRWVIAENQRRARIGLAPMSWSEEGQARSAAMLRVLEAAFGG